MATRHLWVSYREEPDPAAALLRDFSRQPPPVDVEVMARVLGFEVFSTPSPYGLGSLAEGPDALVLAVPTEEPARRYALAFLLGLVLRARLLRWPSAQATAQHEEEARLFAADLLMPPALVREVLSSGGYPEELERLFEVPEHLVREQLQRVFPPMRRSWQTMRQQVHGPDEVRALLGPHLLLPVDPEHLASLLGVEVGVDRSLAFSGELVFDEASAHIRLGGKDDKPRRLFTLAMLLLALLQEPLGRYVRGAATGTLEERKYAALAGRLLLPPAHLQRALVLMGEAPPSILTRRAFFALLHRVQVSPAALEMALKPLGVLVELNRR